MQRCFSDELSGSSLALPDSKVGIKAGTGCFLIVMHAFQLGIILTVCQSISPQAWQLNNLIIRNNCRIEPFFDTLIENNSADLSQGSLSIVVN